MCAGSVWSHLGDRDEELAPLRLSMEPDRLWADGYDSAVLSVDNESSKPPRIVLAENIHGASVEEITRSGNKWQARIRAGVVPGHVGLRIESPGHRAATAELTVLSADKDSAGDGTPDFLRLEDDQDQQAFRRWFTYLAEVQYFQNAAARPPEINDCAALIRYAYREALHNHDSAWANSARVPVIPALDSVTKYQYPFTPLQGALFRSLTGPFRTTDVSDGAFLQFADVQTLWRFNTHFVSGTFRARAAG